MTIEPLTPESPPLTEDDVRRIVREEVARAFIKDPGSRRAAIIASKGTLDWAYPPLILATAAAAAGMQTAIFFTFYGLNIIHKDAARKLKIDPVGNPAMPMPVPMPDLVTAMPGMVSLASKMMKSRFAKHNVASIATLLRRRPRTRRPPHRLPDDHRRLRLYPGRLHRRRRVRRRRRVHVGGPPLPRHHLRLRRPTVSEPITADETVDARDLMCPMPVLAATKAMRRLEPGQVLKVLATDSGALSDIPAWAQDTANELLSSGTEQGALVFYIRKAPSRRRRLREGWTSRP